MPGMPDTAETLKKLNLLRWLAVADTILFVALMYVAVVDRNDGAVSVLGALHGIGVLAMMYVAAVGAGEGRWPWWLVGAVVIPVGGIVGEEKVRRDLAAA